MIINLSTVFKIVDNEGKDVAFAEPSTSFIINEKKVTSTMQYNALKQLAGSNLPNGYTIIDVTKEELKQYREENE